MMGRDAPSTDAIKAARRAAGLTQVELAQRLGVTARAVQHWEAGTRAMPLAAWILLRQWARVGRTRPHEFN